jgi:DMSO reductase anchor subunit
MHPALSVIFFTTLSGAGLGLLALVASIFAVAPLPLSREYALTPWVAGVVLLCLGLFASLMHLGQPQRAWRALSQWRSSWLSREGVAALATYVPAALLGLGWVVLGATGAWTVATALAAALLALATIACTAMIYRSLKPVQRWCNRWVVPNYIALGLMSGALWLAALMAWWGTGRWSAALALAAIALAAPLKLGYWRFIDTTRAASTPESATGLGAIGKVRLLDPPHTEENYLLKEMGFKLARKHARKLRRIAVALAFVVPFVLVLLAFFAGGVVAAVAASLAALAAMAGLLVERWLFFAEARHTVTLYYGAEVA